jgi:calnexin
MSLCVSYRDDEIDGTWEAPSIDNPLCQTAPGCGKWTPSMIPNPAYKGSWSAPLIDNPNYRVYQSNFFSE